MSDYALIFTDPRLLGDEGKRNVGDTFTAESRTALIDLLIPGYSALDASAKDENRYSYLVAVGNIAQGRLLADAVNNGRIDMADLSQAEIDALLNTSREGPVEWGEWALEVPLVVLPETYAGRPKPTGNVIFLSGENETVMLESLAKLGAIEVQVKGDAI